MKNKFKYDMIIFFLIISTLFNNFSVNANTVENNFKNCTREAKILDVPKVDNSKKIYDFAELLTDKQELKLYNKIEYFITEYNLDMVVVTINEDNKCDKEKYANDFYDYNYFGKNSSFDGIILLIDEFDKMIYIVPKGNAYMIYDTKEIVSMLNYVIAKLYNSNCEMVIEEFIYYANLYFNTNTNHSESEEKVYTGNFIFVLITIIIIMINVVIANSYVYNTVLEHKYINKNKKADNYYNKDLVNVTESKETFISSSTNKKIYIIK